MQDLKIPGLVDIQEAYSRIKKFIHRTPVLTSAQLNLVYGADLYFKCENFQKAGAFKFRGATNAVINLGDKERSRGVITHSSGNHAAALALAAKQRDIPAYIVMPSTSLQVKRDAVIGYGAEVTICDPTLEAREAAAEKIISEKGPSFIHPYDNFNVICGQGTAALEFLTEYPDLDIVICPVGGGGLLSGTLTAVKGINSNIKVYAAEPEGADDTYRSIKSGVRVLSHKPNTIADGLLTIPSDLTYKIILDNVDDIFTVCEKDIIESMRLVWERMKIVIEPSSAVSLAVIKNNPEVFRNKKVGVIISGGNVDLRKLPF